MSSGEEQPKTNRLPLTEMAITYFKKKGYKINGENITIEGHSGMPRHFDFIVQKNNSEQGVWIRDWNRTIGVNVIITLDTVSEDAGLTNPIMIGEKFSDHAKSYANRRKIELLTKQKLETLR